MGGIARPYHDTCEDENLEVDLSLATHRLVIGHQDVSTGSNSYAAQPPAFASMMAYSARNLLSEFNVEQGAFDFLLDIIQNGTSPNEVHVLLQHSSVGDAAVGPPSVPDGRPKTRPKMRVRVADPLHVIGAGKCTLPHCDHWSRGPSPRAWAETDRLIALARKLEHGRQTCLFASKSGVSNDRFVGRGLDSTPARRQRGASSSRSSDTARLRPRIEKYVNKSTAQLEEANPAFRPSQRDARSRNASHRPSHFEQPDPQNLGNGGGGKQAVKNAPSTFATTRSSASPYFSPSLSTAVESAARGKKRKKQPPAGTVSCVPFPPLSSPRFGIIQEQMAREPFWLLIVVTFLIKTKGRIAVPVFRKVRERFPSPAQLADPANTDELSDMVRHLGLVSQRVRYIQRYARTFLQQPPRAGARFKVNNYPRRVIQPCPEDIPEPEASVDAQPEARVRDEEPLLWEIGHMTQGSYAIDSWRIFCRDELLGRAEDWKGTGSQPDHQPEWTRVLPQDKELRAYLRWMWMREGWQWDPETGRRSVLRDDLRRAVDEGRVDYDQAGGLRILEQA